MAIDFFVTHDHLLFSDSTVFRMEDEFQFDSLEENLVSVSKTRAIYFDKYIKYITFRRHSVVCFCCQNVYVGTVLSCVT